MNYFKNAYQYKWSNTSQIENLLKNYDASKPHSITFATPQLHCYGDMPFKRLFEMNVTTNVYRTVTQRTQILENGTYKVEDVDGTKELYASFDSGPVSISNADNSVCLVKDNTAYLRRILSDSKRDQFNSAGDWSKFYTVTSALANVRPDNVANITVDLTPLSAHEIDGGKGYRYDVECTASPLNASAMLSYYEAIQTGESVMRPNYPLPIQKFDWDISTKTATVVDASAIKITATFYHKDMSLRAIGSDFLVAPRKYNCYDLLRKALLTCDTKIFDNTKTGLDDLQYCIEVPEKWKNRLKAQPMYETVLEQKNLWEVLLQIGYYLHAIPYLAFAEDGTDRFTLNFKQLGDTKKRKDTSSKITVFNSRNLQDYFTQYDCYVTNLFSPQNLIEEWVVPKTSDSSYLVSNDVAELHLKYPVHEIDEFSVIYNGETKSAKDYIFEQSIYSILSPGTEVRPSKSTSVYYSLGDNKILGLTYSAPSEDNDAPYALKNIISTLFGIDASGIKFNDVMFYIKYRTQESIRLSQVRPDLHLYMKNSSCESYPHHEQFYGQQDKIVDSERFSANLWGRLIRVGNNIVQRQEYVRDANEKQVGDLVVINGENYYVTAIDSENYRESILQKVTYSKNFNQLSNIVTIPSEPRFYEVSERSMVRREVRLMEFLMLTSKEAHDVKPPVYLNTFKWQKFIKSVLFGEDYVSLPNFAFVRFMADGKRTHTGSAGQTLPADKLFPSVEVEWNPELNSMTPKASSNHRDVIVPLLHFPLRNAIAFAWDMDDNFKAGDCVDTTINGSNDTADKAYYSLQPVRYCDVMGRADLFDFRLFNKTDWLMRQSRRLPFAETSDFTPSGAESIALVKDLKTIGLDKDNREGLSFNYQINLLHEDCSFVTFANLFGRKKSRLKICLLNKEISMFDQTIEISGATTIADDIEYELVDRSNCIEVKLNHNVDIDSGVKAIVAYEEEGAAKCPCIARNVGNLNYNKMQSWWIYPVFNDR